MGTVAILAQETRTMATPLVKRKVVKKAPTRFTRFQAHFNKRMNPAWRKPRGIDCSVRRRYKGSIPMPKIGYGSNKKTKHRVPNGFYKFRVTSASDIEMLLMHNGKYAAELAHNLSSKTRAAIIKRADQLNVCVLNRNARVSTEENE